MFGRGNKGQRWPETVELKGKVSEMSAASLPGGWIFLQDTKAEKKKKLFGFHQLTFRILLPMRSERLQIIRCFIFGKTAAILAILWRSNTANELYSHTGALT